VTGRRGRRRHRQLLDELKERRGKMEIEGRNTTSVALCVELALEETMDLS
jgi:hypothetical protein